MKCPVCQSTRTREINDCFYCDKCGYRRLSKEEIDKLIEDSITKDDK